jgi:uncharacterized Ntn-hydrolase superfamily protein
MTYSIVARDPDTGSLGVAVQSCMFSVGTIVLAARAGVGAVATQAIPDPSHRERALLLLDDGLPPDEVLAQIRATDPGDGVRQTALVDSQGRIAATTGELCIDYAGDLSGPGYSVQANMMANPSVWRAMAGAYESSSGSLARRLLAALVGAQAAGGDARGQMSAAMIVVRGDVVSESWGGVEVDVRVDEHERPLDELARLVNAAEAFAHYNRAVEALFGGDPATALAEAAAAHALLPREGNIEFVRAGALAFNGELDAAVAAVRSLVAAVPSWAIVVRSFSEKGLLPLPGGLTIDDVLDGPPT